MTSLKELEKIRNTIDKLCEMGLLILHKDYRGLDIIENELKEYKKIKKIMDHYGIKNIQELKQTIHAQGVDEQYKREVVEPLEKKAKALEIIINKNVNIYKVRICPEAERYNFFADRLEVTIEPEEFDLIKEELRK